MGSKNSPPPPPDYSQLASASEKAAEYSFNLGMEQLDWAREQYAGDRAVIDLVVASALNRQEVNDEAALADRERYEQVYQPLEDIAAQEAISYASPERQELEAGKASAEVAQQFDAQRRAAAQSLEAYGIDPSSTRYAALDLGSRVQQAAAQAGAANQSRAQTEAIGRALRSEAVNVGRGYPGQVAGTYATALQSGNSAANAALGGTASGANTMGTAPQWQALGQGAIGTWGNVLNTGYQNQLAAFNAEQNASSGLGSLAGALVGTFFESGGAVPPTDATTGGNVPATASPTGGKAIDDVPSMLTAGEFVVPKDAVQWFGERHFQQLIEKSRKERASAPAKPEYAALPAQNPTFVSRPQEALPTR